jgi:hypothetical protein
MRDTIGKVRVKPLAWYVTGLVVVLLTGIAIGGMWTRRSGEAGASRIDAYSRCTALIDKGAQWEESEGTWRCRVVPSSTK